MKKVLSVILAVCMLVSVFAIVPMAAGAETATKTIQVGVIEYLNLTGQYQVHYWGGATSGDVNLTPINTQKMKSVGNEFWDGDEQKFNMNEAAIPADATGFKVHCGDIWFGGDGVVADSNQAFVFEWGNVYRALYAYEAPAADPTTAPTEAPTAAPTTAPETEAPIVGGTTYYVVGSFTDWGTDAEYALTANAATEGEYMITGVALAKDDEFKVVGVQGGVQGGTTWYPDNADNYKVAADGTYDIYFRPDGQGGEGWYNGYFYVAAAEPETTVPTEAPTAAPTTAPTEPVVGGTTYYLVGTFTDWQSSDDYALTANAAAEGEYMITGVELAKDDEFKVLGVTAGVQGGNPTWYPDNADNYKIAADGTYDIYFRPDGNGGEGWYCSCIYVAAQEEPTQPASEPETTAPTTAPETTAPVVGEEVTLYFTNNKGWSDVKAHMWKDGGESTEWPGAAATYVKDNDYGEAIYSATINTATYDHVIFNGNGGQTVNIAVADAVAGGCGVYCLDTQDGDGHYNVGFYQYNAEPSSEPETQPATQPIVGGSTFYVEGTFTDWQANEAYAMTKNTAAEVNEYMLLGVSLKKDDEFKVVETNGSIQGFEPKWYPEGMDNNYKVAADGTYDIYFRPDYNGGDDWFASCIYVAESAVQPTEPATQPETQPASEPDEPFTGIKDGKYYVNDVLTKGAGVVEFEGDLYYINSAGGIYVGWIKVTEAKANGLVEPGKHEFGADGKMIIPTDVKNGIVDGYYYENDVLMKGKGIVEIDGDYYFVRSDGSILKNGSVKVTETKANGLVNPGKYSFDADGKMILKVNNGVVDGYYYVDGELVKGVGLVEFEGNLYFVQNDGSVAKSVKRGVSETKANGLADPGYYDFDADGKLIRNGIFGGKYYENNELMKGKGVVEYKGALYFVRTDGTIFKDGKVGISAAKANGYVAAGYYFADADGKLIIENQAA